MVFKIDQVGIGTSSPGELLQVDGNIKIRTNNDDDLYLKGSSLYRHFISNSTDVGSGIHFTNATILPTNYAGQDQADTIDFGSTTRRFKTLFSTGLDVSGDVGIGVEIPDYKLQVFTDTNGDGFGLRDTSNELFAVKKSSNGCFLEMYESGTTTVKLNTNGDSYLSGGNVGIGESSPQQELDVDGRIRANSMEIDDYIYHVGDTDTYMGFESLDVFKLVTGNSEQMRVDSNGIQATYFAASGDTNTRMRFSTADNIIFDTNNTERMRINSSGDVGIGGIVPESRLHIYSSVSALMFQSMSSPYPKLSFDWSGSNAENFQFYDNGHTHNSTTVGSQRGFLYGRKYTVGVTPNSLAGWWFYGNDDTLGLRIDGSANVGIGVVSPSAKFHVETTGSADVGRFFRPNAGNGDPTTIHLGRNAATNDCAQFRYVYGGSTNNSSSRIDLGFYGNGSILNITAGGLVGIGVVPTRKLDVNGDVFIRGENIYLAWDNDQRLISNYDNHYRQGIHFDASSRTMKLFSTTNDSTGGDIAFNTRAASGVNDTDYGTEKMRIKNGGYVGIGTTSPDNKLEVRGNLSISSSDTDSMRIDSGGGVIRRKWTINSSTYGSGLYLSDNVILPTNYLGSTVNLGINLGSTSNRWNTIYTGTLNTSGDVGIGTTSPNEKLEIYGNGIRIHDPSSSPKLDFVRGGTSRYPNTQTFGLSNYSDWRITANGMNLSFQNQWTGGNSGNLLTAMTLKHSTGYVGIGTDNPDRPLHVYNGSGHCWVEIETSASGGDAELILKSTTSQWSIWNNGSDDKLRFYEGGDRMIIDGTGRVGIGAQPGYAWLHVGGAQYSSLGNYNSEYSYSRSDSADWAHQHHPGTATFNWGIYSNYAIGTSYAFVHSSSSFSASDERIKKNIVDADDTECLETLRLLKPKKYQYKDVIKRGEEPVWGFIAQEVRETLPYGTRFIQSVLPNIYELANVSSSNVITFTDFNTSDLESNATTLIRTKGIDDEDHDIHLVEIIDAHTIRVEEDLTKWIGSVDDTGNVVDGNQLFVYGQEVDDFVYIQKDAIWTIATAALQEVDRQLQAEKTKTAALETQLASVLARVTTLENV